MSFKEILSIPGIKAVFFTLFMTAFGFGIILPLLPFYALAHGAQPFQLGMLTATFALMSILFGPVMGRMGDRIGRKKVLLIGTTGFAVAYVIFAFADSLEMLFLARAIEGIAAAGIFPSCISLLSDLTSEKQRGMAMGMVSMAFSFGLIIGPSFGGVTAAISVRDAFLLAALFALLNFASVVLQIREPREKRESRDIAQKEVSLLSHISSPLLFLFLSTFMVAFMIGGLDATLALYTGERMGFTSAQVGLLFTYVGFLILVMQFVSGNFVNRFGELALIRAGFLLSGLGFALLVFTHDWISILVPLAVFVAGNALVFPSVNSLITKKVTGKRGAVLGLVSSFQSLGQFVGPLLGGFLYGLHHEWAFAGLAAVIWAYFLIFHFVGKSRLITSAAK
ncbi:MFS transporter [Candidatus Micrarchaeota archaeon]|nr:MFS transporter [Candidatus Micrarchaeota archaeon]